MGLNNVALKYTN